MSAFTFKYHVLAFVAVLLLQGCSTNNPYYDPTKTHHRPNGFVNSDGTTVSKTFNDLIRWYQERFGKTLPPPPGEFIPSYKDFPVHKFNAQKDLTDLPNTATWLGHAAVLIRNNEFTLLTDPHFSERAFPVQWMGPKRKIKSPVKVMDLPKIDVVVISHNHYDHMDKHSILKLVHILVSGEHLFWNAVNSDSGAA